MKYKFFFFFYYYEHFLMCEHFQFGHFEKVHISYKLENLNYILYIHDILYAFDQCVVL